MIFAIDYDKTYDQTPELWDMFIEQAKKDGHRPLIVTMRDRENEDDIIKHSIPCEIIYTALQPKLSYLAQNYGIYNAIWIDDNPRWIK